MHSYFHRLFAFSICSTIELNAARHPVYSELFSVTNVRRRLASGLASLITSSYHFPWNGLGTDVTSPLCCSNRKENFFPPKEEFPMISTANYCCSQLLQDSSLSVAAFLSLCISTNKKQPHQVHVFEQRQVNSAPCVRATGMLRGLTRSTGPGRKAQIVPAVRGKHKNVCSLHSAPSWVCFAWMRDH